MVEKVESFIQDTWQLIVLIVGQIFAGAWYVSKLSSRVAQNEKDISIILRDSSLRTDAVAAINGRLIRQEAILEQIYKKLDRIVS